MSCAAAVFDLDGVITFTAAVHAAAWKAVFDEYLKERERRFGERFQPFTDEDYRRYVDGRPRQDGVRGFLSARGITIPEGGPADSPDMETMMAIGIRKNDAFRERLRDVGAEVDQHAVTLVRELQALGVPVGMASSSKNAGPILETAGMSDLFQAHVDGLVSAELGLQGKPAPDIFLKCLELLGGHPADRSLVVEDAVSGVKAGRAGGFGMVLGVDRGEAAIPLRENGADLVIGDFREVSPQLVNDYLAQREFRRPNILAEWKGFTSRLSGYEPLPILDVDALKDRLGEQVHKVIQRMIPARPVVLLSGIGNAGESHDVEPGFVYGIDRESFKRELLKTAPCGTRSSGSREVHTTGKAFGNALAEMLPQLGGAAEGTMPVLIGSEASEDLFQALEGSGLAVIVTAMPRATAAHYSAQNVVELEELLRRLGQSGNVSG